MRLVVAFAFLATAATAQPWPEFSVSTDKNEYASGEPIDVTVRITNPTEETIRYFFSSGCQFYFDLDGTEVSYGPCTLSMTWTTIGQDLQWQGKARIWPDSTGYPETSGAHVLTARADLDGFAMTPGALAPGPIPTEFRLPSATAEFTAPAADAGVVSVAFPASTDPATLESVRTAINADVLNTRLIGETRLETWQVSGAPLASIVATYENDSRFSSFEIDMESRAVNVDQGEIVTSTARLTLVPSGMQTFPNPCRFECAIELRAQDLPGPVRVAVYDARGREVAVIHDGPLALETQRWTLPVASWSAGTYLIRADVEGRRFASTTLALAR